MPITHILRNLYFNFVIPLAEYQLLKQDTMRLIQRDQSLLQLLKPSDSPFENSQ